MVDALGAALDPRSHAALAVVFENPCRTPCIQKNPARLVAPIPCVVCPLTLAMHTLADQEEHRYRSMIKLLVWGGMSALVHVLVLLPVLATRFHTGTHVASSEATPQQVVCDPDDGMAQLASDPRFQCLSVSVPDITATEPSQEIQAKLPPDIAEKTPPKKDPQKPVTIDIESHAKAVDQDQFPDEKDNTDATLIAAKNHRSKNTAIALPGKPADKPGPIDVPRERPPTSSSASSGNSTTAVSGGKPNFLTGADGKLLRLDQLISPEGYKDLLAKAAAQAAGVHTLETQRGRMQAWSDEFNAILSSSKLAYGEKMLDIGSLNTRAHPAAAYLSEIHGKIHAQWAEKLWNQARNMTHLSEQTGVIFLLIVNSDGSLCNIHRYLSTNTDSIYESAALTSLKWALPLPVPPPNLHSPNGKTYLTWGFFRDGRQCHTNDASVHLPQRGKENETCRPLLEKLTHRKT